MKISEKPPIDLTYCLNVHPGETWNEQFQAIRENTLVIRDAVTEGRSDRRFGLGLRLSALSAQQLLSVEGELETFKAFLDEDDLYVFTVNGFPYGQFHQTEVKDRVYQPDWTQPTRREYTETIARVLTELIAEGEMASISTAPLTFKGWPDWQKNIASGLEQLAETAYALWQLYQASGRRVVIAMEPEPYCYPETTPELLEVFDALRHDVAPRVLKRHGVSASEAAEIVQNHLGACFDTAHQAVEFEDLTSSLRSLLDADVPIAKVQLSAALEVDTAVVPWEQLERFADTTYLHQSYLQAADGTIKRYADLPELAKKVSGTFCAKHPPGRSGKRYLTPFSLAEASSLRIHYHWPLYQQGAQDGIKSTSDLLCGEFAELLRAGKCPHWEIETYTWNVLLETAGQPPIDLRTGIVREFQWVLENLL